MTALYCHTEVIRWLTTLSSYSTGSTDGFVFGAVRKGDSIPDAESIGVPAAEDVAKPAQESAEAAARRMPRARPHRPKLSPRKVRTQRQQPLRMNGQPLKPTATHQAAAKPPAFEAGNLHFPSGMEDQHDVSYVKKNLLLPELRHSGWAWVGSIVQRFCSGASRALRFVG